MEDNSAELEINQENSQSKDYVSAIVDAIREPLLVVDSRFTVVRANKSFYKKFKLSNSHINGESVFALNGNQFDTPEFREILEKINDTGVSIKDAKLNVDLPCKGLCDFLVNASCLETPGGKLQILLAFKKQKTNSHLTKKERNFLERFKEIFSKAPASICTLRGPEHIFEIANENYLNLVRHRDIVGKSVAEALPEIATQGFIELLDKVYTTAEPYIGNEIPIKLDIGGGRMKTSYLNFLYQPTRKKNGEVEGIFVHALDVTEQVEARKKIEESETYLKNLIDTVPAIIWITNQEGHSIYLNKNWYNYTGQQNEEAHIYGWVNAVHPEDREAAASAFRLANKERISYHVSFRLRNKTGEYRWVMDSGSPKYNAEGEYEGMIGTVVDIHEEKSKENLIKEKEHRIHNIVQEATVATAIYAGPEMKIELANDAMVKLWGKDRSVVGKTLHHALPELEGQPFHELLNEVYTTGKIYWGKEDKVDLMINGKLQTGYYNFTYKPLRNENGEVYGILNMAVDVTEMVKSKMLLKESEAHFRQMADLMPGKVTNTDAKGKSVYFNQNWLEYTGFDSNNLKEHGWRRFIHPEDRENFDANWHNSLKDDTDFEMELRLMDKSGKYKWHISRAESVKDEFGNIKMWIGTNTEIHKLKEEEKRKEDFLKMVSHELKTPVTSIKGYVQLLLTLIKQENITNSKIPLKPSLERIDHQVSRLTRLISEILDLSRIEENKLDLQKKKFDLNEMVLETVQDINYTNTQHKIEVLNEFECKVEGDEDRLGQVLINFITNAIKYSPESQEIKVRVRRYGENQVQVCVKDFGIGIDKTNHKKIFKRFYRIGVKSEETYSGFGIGLFLANEIIERHGGKVKLNSKVGEGSEFSFILDIAEETKE